MVLTLARHAVDHTARDAAQRHLGEGCQRREADSPVDTATQDEPGARGDH